MSADLAAIPFPAGAVEALRDGQRQLDQEGVEVGVSRQAVDEVLSWIDRYVPRSIRTAETVVVDDGYSELMIVTEDPATAFDLIRLNGIAFVPEVVEVAPSPHFAALIAKAEAWPGWEGEDALSSSAMGPFLLDMAAALATVSDLVERLAVAERVRDDCRRASNRNIERRRSFGAMLVEAAKQFREYERLHRAKLADINPDRDCDTVQAEAAAIIAKAERNAAMAARIEALLADWPS